MPFVIQLDGRTNTSGWADGLTVWRRFRLVSVKTVAEASPLRANFKIRFRNLWLISFEE